MPTLSVSSTSRFERVYRIGSSGERTWHFELKQYRGERLVSIQTIDLLCGCPGCTETAVQPGRKKRRYDVSGWVEKAGHLRQLSDRFPIEQLFERYGGTVFALCLQIWQTELAGSCSNAVFQRAALMVRCTAIRH